MLEINAAVSAILNKIGSSYDIRESIGALISAIGAAIEDGDVRVMISCDMDYLQIEVERQRWRLCSPLKDKTEKDEAQTSAPESDSTSVEG